MNRLRFALLCTAVLAVAGCSRNLLRTGGEDAVVVKDVAVDFQPGDRGDVNVELEVRNPGLPPGALTSVQWEVWLGNRWFAAGTQVLDEPLPADGTQRVKVLLPIVFHRNAPASEDPRAVEVGLRGAVTVQAGGSAQRLPFQVRRTLVTRNAPVWANPADEL